MSEELAPKTCSIERLITLEDDIKLVLSGDKMVTRRNARYADPGEIMELGEHSFEVYNVYQQALGDMTEADAKAEGFPDFEAYKAHILSMHKGMPWIPQAKVWVHEFRPA
ncbi:MAG: ASCH domain-containing protein [Paenibacillaceae bacterium]